MKNRPTVVPSPEASALTTPEAAAYFLNIKPATLEQWRWNGRGPRFCKISRSVRYRKIDLDFFWKSEFLSTTEAQAAV